MVTAAGERITAGPEEHADLFWALRGGGGNFGVVTSFTYRLHPVGEVVGGLILHPIERAGEVLAFYRDYMLTAPDTLTVHAGLLTLPEGTKVAAFVVGCIAGGREGEAMVRPLREMGAPMADLIRPMSYLDLQQLLDASYPPGLHHYWKSSFLTRLDDPAIETLIAHFLEAPTPQSHLIVERLGGAIARVPAGATAFAHREMPFDLFILGVSTDRSEHAACAAWARTLWQAMGPSLGPGAYLNYLGAETDEGRDRVTAAYGAHYPRLAAVKAAYDPENRFRVNHNIAPASRGERRASGGEK
jgi:FAD/FMN-containing dehydrogenase